MKKLIVCCDGTWNTMDQEQNGVPIPTNVAKLYFSLESSDAQGNQQHGYYHPGMGTEPTFRDKVFGGAFGDGLDKNIKSAYRWICDHYEQGDLLYLFGFSRGAFTARSLSGFLNKCGTLNFNNLDESTIWQRVDVAYRQGYKNKEKKWLASGWQQKIQSDDMFIYFVGVWDTVGALGVPDHLPATSLLNRLKNYHFHDTNLSPKIRIARHALALNEKRASFTPTLWTKIPEECDVKQVWFPGVHSDVGGGYPETGLSDGALEWMMQEAQAAGLAFNPSKLAQITPDFQGVLHNSYAGIFKKMGSQPRSTPAITAPEIHQSALKRHQSPPITEQAYMPIKTLQVGETHSFKIFARDEWNYTGLYVQAGEQYEFSASGEWVDSTIKAGPEGTEKSPWSIGKLIQSGLTLLGKVEKKLRNPYANFIGTKREESMSWFALIGVIANGLEPTINGNPPKHETFLIGNGCVHTVKDLGYFYAFANDAWNFYDNNHGSVTLLVKRAR